MNMMQLILCNSHFPQSAKIYFEQRMHMDWIFHLLFACEMQQHREKGMREMLMSY